MGAPLISVVVPCYNHSQFLDDSVGSVVNQTFASWECIVVDDGSTDSTEEVAKRLMQTDSRIRYLRKTNGGLSDSRNKGIEAATGTFILPLDADDKISPTYMEQAMKAFEKHPETKLVYAKAMLFGAQQGEWQLDEYSFESLLCGNMIFCTSFYRKTDWQKTGGYDTHMKGGWEDWDFLIALLKDGGSVIQLPEFHFFYRIREASMVRSLDDSTRKALFEVLSRKHMGIYVAHFSFAQVLWENRGLKKENRKLKSKIDSYQSHPYRKVVRFFSRLLSDKS